MFECLHDARCRRGLLRSRDGVHNLVPASTLYSATFKRTRAGRHGAAARASRDRSCSPQPGCRVARRRMGVASRTVGMAARPVGESTERRRVRTVGVRSRVGRGALVRTRRVARRCGDRDPRSGPPGRRGGRLGGSRQCGREHEHDGADASLTRNVSATKTLIHFSGSGSERRRTCLAYAPRDAAELRAAVSDGARLQARLRVRWQGSGAAADPRHRRQLRDVVSGDT